jgi:hypothetical protein
MEHVPNGEVLPPTVYGNLKPADRFKRIADDLLQTNGVYTHGENLPTVTFAKWQSMSTGLYYNLQKQIKSTVDWETLELSVYKKLGDNSGYQLITTYSINDHISNQAVMNEEGTDVEFKQLDEGILEEMLQIISEANPDFAKQLSEQAVDKRFWQLVGHYLISSNEAEEILDQEDFCKNPKSKLKLATAVLAQFNQSLKQVYNEQDYIPEEINTGKPRGNYHNGPKYSMSINYAANQYKRGGARLHNLR